MYHLVIGDLLEGPGRGIDPGVYGVDGVHIGVDLAAAAQFGGDGHGRGIAAAPAQGGDVPIFGDALETGDDHHFAFLQVLFHPLGVDLFDEGLGVDGVCANLPKILTAGVQIISKLAVGLVRGIPALIGKIPSMVSQIRNAFTSVNWGSVGMNIVKGIASGLANAGGVIVKAAKSAAKSALDAAKSALGIHSPSRVFRDQVGKMMALGMGIGFEKNIPLKSMNVGVQRAVSGLQKSVDLALSARTADKTVGRVKNYPGFDGGKDIDYDRLEKIQMRAAEKMAKRPIYLGTKRIDEPLPKGAVPAL